MDIEEFRKRGYETVDRICKYYQELENYEVLSKVEPGYLKKVLPKEVPEEPEPWEKIQSDIETKIIPGITHWQSPNFFAFYPANSSFPSILGDMYSDMFNVIGFNWASSPACTELESIVLDWMGKLIGLDPNFHSDGRGGGVIQGTASEATLVTLLAARYRMLEEYKAKGLDGEELRTISTRLIAYGSDQTHPCLNKATMIANTRFRALPTDNNFSLCGETVKQEIEKDIANGLIPFFIVGTIGTTNSAAIDKITDIVDAIKGTNIWLHIDAAYAGSALICSEYKYLLEGINQANSFDLNMHKGLLTNFDCSCLWIKERKYLINALSTASPDFLKNSASKDGLGLDFKDWQIPFGRRFRALKIWFVIRTYGAKGLREHIRKRHNLAKQFYNKILQYPDLFIIPLPSNFGLVNFYIKSSNSSKNSNKLTEMVYNRLNENGKVYLTQTKMRGQNMIRFAPGSPLTIERHINQICELLLNITQEVIAISL
ncbi:pyridoxal-dependent decarboxylase conserved domain-containing protein [Glomus cerebriforme]|uniref:Pyridoxal-dependent decarboxylase conserved domain-containing protein n=1 Tax=Glomus cerebriforme TaxID=658196 RepID=A0A397SUU2_9GLOM|nr:pyridoxal-dependent decarboxylase conserved domain-containing protein [Glomus cerebriforme]